ncbi:hypothetical protein L6452_27926 [Arctium lappa]|uniref:Uncharacterized protein n=1 Tax=Arctium lappa TaxID=4217 RepID=A0ACB8ZWW6_ARCLA|nr:hypothetical protein L6452_27926 [Arctium lappa]
MIWRVKDSSEEKKKYKASASTTNANKNSVHKGNSFGNSDIYYSTNHLIRVAQKKICCSYCGAHDFEKCLQRLLQRECLQSSDVVFRASDEAISDVFC